MGSPRLSPRVEQLPWLQAQGLREALDLATLARRRGEPEDIARARSRAAVTSWSVVGVVAGCAGGAILELRCGLGALALPVTLAALAIPLRTME
jgi:hypothetical protein